MDKNATATQFNDLIESKVGMSIDQIRHSSSESMARHIEKSSGSPLMLGDSNRTLTYRGNMLLAIGKVVKDIDALFNRKFDIR